MKKFNIVMILGLGFLTTQSTMIAQQYAGVIQTTTIKPLKIEVCYNKTSNLIFPYAIKSVDRGSASVLVQKAKGVENILQVKAAQQGFDNTNLTVVTSDGRFYSFIIDYAAEPSPLNLSFNKDTTDAFLSDAPMNEMVLKSLTEKVQIQPNFLHKTMEDQKMWLSLKSIYLSGGDMWFKLRLRNYSLINYTPENIRFFIRDKKRSTRTAVQENELQPVYKQPSVAVKGLEGEDLIYGFPSFTIPKTQELIIQVDEQNGGRTLILTVNHKAILKARLLKN